MLPYALESTVMNRISLLLVFVLGCGARRADPGAHGVDVKPGRCGRGVVVVETDYQSSNVSLLAFDGEILTQSFTSSGTQGSGFSVSFGPDAVPPSGLQQGDTLAFIDRYPAGIVRFVNVSSGNVIAELPVGTGFRSNPQDYLQLSDDKAYVSRYNSNPNAGRQDWDAGGDILLVDPSTPSVLGRIDLSQAMRGEPDEFWPRPAQLAKVGERVFALLAGYSDDYLRATTARLIEIDPSTNSLLSTLVLGTLRGCGTFAVSPNGRELAIACPGDDLTHAPPSLEASGIALVDITREPRLVRTLAARDLGTNVIGFGIAYAKDAVLLVSTMGYFDDSAGSYAPDTLLRLDLLTLAQDELLRSADAPFTLGSVRCAPECGACFATDAGRGTVHRFSLESDGSVTGDTPIKVEARVGLPPRYLGTF
jgi:hypothetical protein